MPMLPFILVVAGASEGTNTVSTVTDAVTSGLSSAGSELLGVVAKVVPVVIPVMIGITAIGIGIKVFKKVTGK